MNRFAKITLMLFSIAVVVAVGIFSITQNSPIDNPPINEATQTFTLFRC